MDSSSISFNRSPTGDKRWWTWGPKWQIYGKFQKSQKWSRMILDDSREVQEAFFATRASLKRSQFEDLTASQTHPLGAIWTHKIIRGVASAPRVFINIIRCSSIYIYIYIRTLFFPVASRRLFRRAPVTHAYLQNSEKNQHTLNKPSQRTFHSVCNSQSDLANYN